MNRPSPSRQRLAAGLLAGLLSLAACSRPPAGTDVLVAGMANPEVALRESMSAVDTEMSRLGGTGRAQSRFAEPVVPGELQRTVTLAYAGPLEAGVRKLAETVGYAVEVAAPPGSSAIPPVDVSVSTGFVPALKAFEALGAAAGSRAMVRVDPQRHLVQVLYRA